MAGEESWGNWGDLKEACLATLGAMNERLASEFPDLALRVDMVDAPMARKLGKVFRFQDADRRVDWNWENLFHKRVKREKTAWMFVVLVADEHGAVCYGTISIDNGCVSIEYLERKLGLAALKGIAAQIAILYAEALAVYLGLGEVRVCDPDPALLAFYEQNFGLNRYSDAEEVTYLFKKVQP